MAAKKNPLSDKAYELYKQGMKLVDIAAELEVPPGTVRRWKSTHGWDGERSECDTSKKSERSGKKRTEKKPTIDDGTRETLQNEDLTAEQQMFCIYYSRTFNAAQSYQKAYGCTYESALCAGPRLLGNVRASRSSPAPRTWWSFRCVSRLRTLAIICHSGVRMCRSWERSARSRIPTPSSTLLKR